MSPATRSTSPAEAYRLSDTENKFIIVGCYTVAYITVGDREDMRYASACSAFCGPKGNNLTSLMDGACSGTGCCEATITEGHTSYNTMFDPDYNTTQIYNVSSCSYVVLMESSRFSFRRSYVMNSSQFIDTNGGRVPMVVDWAVQNASNCVEAQKDHDSYACISSNSVCVNSSRGWTSPATWNGSRGGGGDGNAEAAVDLLLRRWVTSASLLFFFLFRTFSPAH